MTVRIKLIVLFAFAVFSHSLNAQETQKPAADAGELAKKLANPLRHSSVPFKITQMLVLVFIMVTKTQ
jgi:hypothetical protein